MKGTEVPNPRRSSAGKLLKDSDIGVKIEINLSR